MVRHYGAQITVVEDEGRPARFTWDGRLYGVRRIIDHWVSLRTDRTPAPGGGASERWHWRVEAGTVRAQGVYELRKDTATGQWSLARVWG
ncbi:DUF6504 family protein [Nocardiopsis kunsanensis]|uniref:DUF6504 domain-containing protein n=1 Tax=Nocardiopsis kunsanensis TaxID=141693 RepID=A0A919CLQ9_9ACTN|nr:DUF6504 family protein [Nocardiopsis kunsanensis]GHD34103.1 hypothetical protein GCM10007147_39390 [Nocardiopsis kunsanensis]